MNLCAAAVDKPKLTVLSEKQPIILYLLSQLRDEKTKTADFRHFNDRIMRLLIEEAIA